MFLEAERELAVTLQLNPTQSDAYANLGHISFPAGKTWNQAVEEFMRAIALGSEKPDTYYFSGLAWSKQGVLFRSHSLFATSRQHASDIKPIIILIWGTHINISRYFDEALQEFRKTLKIQPEHPQAQNNIGVIFWNLKSYEKAEIEFKKALRLQNDLTRNPP